MMAAHALRESDAPHGGTASPGSDDVGLRLNPDGSLVQLEPGSWFVCFVPPIAPEWWHPFFHRVHKHVFALRPAGPGQWTLLEPWWSRLLTATVTTQQAAKFLRWGARGDVLLVKEAIPGKSSQVRGLMTCAALAAHLLGRPYFVLTPHQLYKVLVREPGVCHVDVSALLHTDLGTISSSQSRVLEACELCDSDPPRRQPGARKPFCMCCGRDLQPGTRDERAGESA